ncbi:MAG: class I adenylate-forming enzyme family protein [Pseudomonadota bacterium]
MTIIGSPLDTFVDLQAVLKKGLERSPDEVALSSLRGRWTWRELEDVSDRLARNYIGLGLKPGDRFASLMPNRSELFIHYLACFRAGLVTTPLNYRYMAPEIDHALELSGSAILLAHDERKEDLAKTQLASKLPLGVVSYDDDGGTGSLKYGDLAGSEPTVDMPPRHDQDAPCAIFFTSGSTGKPKGVTHSYRTLGWGLGSMVSSIGVSEDDMVMAGSSMSHAGGYWFTTMALACGAHAAVARTFDAAELLPALREKRPTIVFMLPSALYALVRDHDATRDDFSSVRHCFSGGDKVAQQLEDEFVAKTGHPIKELYGMSEIGISNENMHPLEGKFGSVGQACDGFRLEVRGDDGGELPVGEAGTLWSKSPCTMIGYWDNPAATAETMADGWLNTGDIMSRDADDYLWFQGRKKQIIVHDGSNICPQEVEESLLAHDSVIEAGVIGVHDAIHGENVRAYVVLNVDKDSVSTAELIALSRQAVGYKAPEEIFILDEMPLNATGKVDRVSLKQMAAGDAHKHR